MRLLVLLLFCLPLSLAASSKEVVVEIVQLADVRIDGKRPWDIQVHNSSFYSEVLRKGSLGLGESYMAGWWDCEAIDQCFFHILRADLGSKIKPSWNMVWDFLKAKLFNLQSKTKSLEVIEKHYNLGNDLFENMLDGLMTYSCGYWKNAQTLNEAQIAKYDLIAQKLGFTPGMRILDIGCGWGGFAKYVAEHYGVEVVGITLSGNQVEYAQRVTKGLPIEIRLQDYRDLNEQFDRIVSIGMFEHVGVKNYRTFMEVVHRCLKEDGLVLLHTIGGNVSTVKSDAWISRYVFPNGHLPSIAQIGQSIENLFVMEDWHNFSADYDKTLMAWYRNFDANWSKIQANYPAPFYRMWKYYLLSCAGAFRARSIQLWQVVLSKQGVEGGYKSVR